MDYPWYLCQSDADLKKKFSFIQIQEDERLREATNAANHYSRWSLGVSISPENDLRNRYVNIMPYERNRVHLQSRGKNSNDYINASYTKVDVPGQSMSPGYYIATQGPTKATWEQFWQMCYDECPKKDIVIVMVTPLIEHGREKCHQYWPMGEASDTERFSPKIQCPSGDPTRDSTEFRRDLTIKFVDSKRYNNQYTLTTLDLIPKSSREPVKSVHHFYFDQWRDMSRPQEVVPIMELCQHSHRLNSTGNPIIVHCSAGVGRSGTFIALDHLIHDTKDFNFTKGKLLPTAYKRDLIEQIVLQLRLQRMKMVQMSDQFLFIYHAARYLFDLQTGQ
ncbi:tyrosine protein phosphatase PTP1 KNAG_0E02840 [Huiozyma naganishii CBS 8797]|uniref:protein-tyrosine-phosphatase n=1 Tax=Huiozyma naganishii (strain ATCC MYA-139 / BCRC 22969 / CBS 8797 / KCTC 17520 / NBRC 10181 / NCYC 3082 / Yp74L-3) TaxID=1071383 RepID=J7RLX8_HUIN7|nr:hypothetical protein KNAG_0E02840 [Kazachstania naganishii CBS 8797]CCK70543.1 hypothetical protein KNAG_0E02840 [Kazachstania naganishii CBS 8797]